MRFWSLFDPRCSSHSWCVVKNEIDSDRSGSITYPELEAWYIKDAASKPKKKKKEKKKKDWEVEEDPEGDGGSGSEDGE